MLSSNKQNRPLVIQITKFIEGVLSSIAAERIVGEQITSYNAKITVSSSRNEQNSNM